MAAINFQTEVDLIVNVLRWRTDLVVTMPDYENFSFQVRCGEGAHKKLSILQFMGETVFCVSVRVIQEDFNMQYVASDSMTAFGGLIALLKEYPDIKESVVQDLRNLNQHFTVQEVKEPVKVSPPQQLVTSTSELYNSVSVADAGKCKEPVVVATDGSVVALLTEKDWELYSTGNSYTLEDLSLDWVSVPSDGVEVRELPIPDDCYVTKIFAQ